MVTKSFAVLSCVDSATKYQTATLVPDEKNLQLDSWFGKDAGLPTLGHLKPLSPMKAGDGFLTQWPFGLMSTRFIMMLLLELTHD